MANPYHPRRWGCLGWLLAIAVFVVLLLVLWMQNDGDIRAIAASAKAQGVPTSWIGMGLPVTPPGRLAAVHRLNALAAAAKTPEAWTSNGWDPFAPVPEAAQIWMASGGSGVDRDLDEELDQLDSGPFLTRDPASQDDAFARCDWKTVMARFDTWPHSVNEVYACRIAAASPGDLPMLLRRVGRLGQLIDLRDFWSGPCVGRMWVSGVTRARNLGVTDPAWADDADRLADSLTVALPIQARLWFVCPFQSLHAPAKIMLGRMGLMIPTIMDNPVGLNFFYRAGRAPMLERELRVVNWLDHHGCPRTLTDVNGMAPALVMIWYNCPTLLLSSLMDGDVGLSRIRVRLTYVNLLLARWLQSITGLRLLAADLRGTA